MFGHLETCTLVNDLEHRERIARAARTRLARASPQSAAERPQVAKVAWHRRARSAWASVATRIAALAGADLRHRPLG